MLILKVFVNKDQIDEIRIQNKEYIQNDIYNYKIIKPKGYNKFITHKRSTGWKPLVEKVLKTLRGKNNENN